MIGVVDGSWKVPLFRRTAPGSVSRTSLTTPSLVRGATGLAESAGLSDLVIGATVVAIGTSLPELMTTVVAAIRKQAEIAIANVVGSNIFNLFGVLGLAASVSALPIDSSLYRFEVPALVASTVVFMLLAWQGRSINRREGALLLILYAGFLGTALVRGATA